MSVIAQERKADDDLGGTNRGQMIRRFDLTSQDRHDSVEVFGTSIGYVDVRQVKEYDADGEVPL